MQRCSALAFATLILASCSSPQAPSMDFGTLSHDLIYGSLALSPVSATANGYHQHNGIPLDEQLDDYSEAGIAAQRQFYAGFESRIAAVNAASLDREQKADLEIVRNNLALSLLELDTIQSYKHNPTEYVELAGNALFAPYVLDYASKDRRFQHIIRRLEKIPALFGQARVNLVDAPPVWNRVAREENQGNIDLIDVTLRAEVPDALKASYTKAAEMAIAALRDFNTFLETTLSKKTSDWRLGRENYARKFQYVLA